ncbi:MAG: GNAT family N-acetyltransferase [Dechloromonas sp.]|nr:MAG: GNAT family N-acetyltransferase [Dechloromonas sp.]
MIPTTATPSESFSDASANATVIQAVLPHTGKLCRSSICFGESSFNTLFPRDASAKTIKSIVTRCHALAAAFTGGAYACLELFFATLGLSEWYLKAVRASAVATIVREIFIDLGMYVPKIRTAFLRRYKPLILMGEWLSSVTVCRNTPAEVRDEFRSLHREAAGRGTRSPESWLRQHEAIIAGSAFFVYLRDADGRMVGGGLFHVSRDEGLYAVGAYDRALFDKPLGHLVQSHAVNEMKRRGLKWYKIGASAYPGDSPRPSDKEIAISHFKQGFATHHFAALRFEFAGGAER